MKLGLIYKYTNLINGKIYIGQTVQELKNRDKKHFYTKHNDYFHRALNLYGRENFSLEIVEDNIPLEQLDEKEIFYIKECNSYYKNGNGYNMTKGGKWSNSSQKISGKTEIEIKKLLKETNLTYNQIAQKVGATKGIVQSINNGESFRERDINYPIRQKKPTKVPKYLSEEEKKEIINLIFNTKKSFNEIAQQFGVSFYTIHRINNELKKMGNTPRKVEKFSTYMNKLTLEKVREIIYKILFENKKLSDFKEEYNVSRNTVNDITRGLTWKEVTSQFVLPICKNKKINQEIYKNIYGIV